MYKKFAAVGGALVAFLAAVPTASATIGATRLVRSDAFPLAVSDDGHYVLTRTYGFAGYRRTTIPGGASITFAMQDEATMTGNGASVFSRGPGGIYKMNIGGAQARILTDAGGWAYENRDSNATGSVITLRGGNGGLGLTAPFAYNLVSKALTRLSVSTQHAGGYSTVDSTGRYVAYAAYETAGCTKCGGIWVYDMSLKTRTLVTATTSGALSKSGLSSWPAISGDGKHVVFASTATDLVAGATTATTRLYMRDLATKKTVLVSSAVNLPSSGSLSESPYAVNFNGTKVVLLRNGPTYTATNPMNQVFLWERATGITTMLTRGYNGAIPQGPASAALISNNGLLSMFGSNATNLMPTPLPAGSPRVFVKST